MKPLQYTLRTVYHYRGMRTRRIPPETFIPQGCSMYFVIPTACAFRVRFSAIPKGSMSCIEESVYALNLFVGCKT